MLAGTLIAHARYRPRLKDLKVGTKNVDPEDGR